MTTSSTPPQLPPDLAAAIEAVEKKPGDIGALFNLGDLMHNYGQHSQAGKIRDHIAGMVGQGVALGRVDADVVAHVLQRFYVSFAKKIETEQHARQCFQSWLKPVTEYGRSLQDPVLPVPLWQPEKERPWRVAFKLTSADVLGHTEALIELLRHRPPGLPWHDVPLVYHIGTPSERLDRLVRETGAEIVSIYRFTPAPHYFSVQMKWLREHMAQSNVSHFVWVSGPAVAPLSMAMRLAPVQVFWTLKFHPFQIPEVDGYITYGAWSETKRVLHGESWDVVPFMMSKPSAPVAEEEIVQTREQFKQHDILFGTLARTEKMNSEPFLDAVVRILRDNPDAGFLWTGRKRLPGIQAHFDRAGVADRCHFIGWVNTPLYARVLDIFLESFPFGCGLTGIQALEAETAFLSYAAPETQYGMHFLRPLQEYGEAAEKIRRLLAPTDGSGPLLYAANPDEYVALANRLAREPDFRRKVGEAGRSYFREYLTDSPRMADRFMRVLADAKQTLVSS